jgi:ArsR family transcriptional regulator
MEGGSVVMSSQSPAVNRIDVSQYITISTIVNIDAERYAERMTRIRSSNHDPDVRLLGALADPTRLAIVRQLAAESETCACDFTSCCDVGQPTVSHHLRVLREAGIVSSERRGQWIFYRLDPSTAERLGALARGLVPGGLVTADQLLAGRSQQLGKGMVLAARDVARTGA